MPAIEISTNATLVAQSYQDLTDEIPKVGRLQLYRTMQRIQKRMRRPGKKSTRPVRWASKKQRMAYFASEGFGRGIPTVRTGEYVRGWQMIKLENGYGIQNLTPQARFIGGGPFGGGQSRIHQDRWELFREVVVQETEQLPQEVQDEIQILVKRKGFA